jgi:effector-binding domain-containing protein
VSFKFNRIKNRYTTTGLVVVSLTSLFFIGTAMAIEEPKYTVIEQSKPFELRSYEPKIIAEVEVSGDMKEASNRGFRLIADFIFGNNQTPGGDKGKISMTAPVTMEVQSAKGASEKISMTAPVAMAQQGDRWLMHFVMPSEYSMDTLPKPNNSAVKVRELPPTQYAVIRFSGFTGAEKVDKKTNELLAWMAQKGLTPKGPPELARYNAPITPPFFRRNEVMVAY